MDKIDFDYESLEFEEEIRGVIPYPEMGVVLVYTKNKIYEIRIINYSKIMLENIKKRRENIFYLAGYCDRKE